MVGGENEKEGGRKSVEKRRLGTKLGWTPQRRDEKEELREVDEERKVKVEVQEDCICCM